MMESVHTMNLTMYADQHKNIIGSMTQNWKKISTVQKTKKIQKSDKTVKHSNQEVISQCLPKCKILLYFMSIIKESNTVCN